MATSPLAHVDVDYTAGDNESAASYPTLADKLEQGIAISKKALEVYESPAVMWTGGKDSTLVLYLLREVADEYGYAMPPAIFIDHFQHFPEIIEFVERWGEQWETEVIFASNDDIRSVADEPGDDITISDLNERNQHEIREKLGYEEETFPFLLDTYVGNHLLKTVALNDAIEAHDIDGVISGVRWDEQAAREEETFFSPRHDVEKYPPHDRIHPILHFDERAVWEAMWQYVVPDTVPAFPVDGDIPATEADLPEGVTATDLPISPQYWEGFRSLGSEVSTVKSSEEPAWQQDLDHTVEREGRAQDKEDLMGRLRDLGYM